ncbi:hypothetical protein MF271_24380 (plasmid) [Deinococcus sp. KNUC1210]|uniref:hypothetical protein n=1 Tax=Deinococcus sp. KNUC1210 TaxID=2917691 RepID=UPI001EF12331|nr:hypothetical protein [Deinococcus sp. KNUC1210]ULH18095.1 hypothetical protein MF271_24380 [Deinococcus sp. KNUC1210]
MHKNLLIPLFIGATTLLSACGPTSATTVTPPASGGGTVTPPTTIPPMPANTPFKFLTHEITIHAGESIKIGANSDFGEFTPFPPGAGLTNELVAGTSREQLITAAPTTYTYDTYLVSRSMPDISPTTFDWVKIHVVGSAPAPWLHPEVLTNKAGPVENEFVRLLNIARSQGGTCTDNSGSGQPTQAWPPAPPVTLNEQASGGLRVKAKDAVLRSWYIHESPEDMGWADFIEQAGMYGFINEALFTGGGDPASPNGPADPTAEASAILKGFLHSYYHCNMMLSSAIEGGGQVAVGWYAGIDPRYGAMEVMPVSFTDHSGALHDPLIKLN